MDQRNPYRFVSGIFAAAWVIAAWFRPEADFVFFPVLVAASFPVTYRLMMGPLPAPLAAGTAAAGVANAIVATLVMMVAGILADARLFPALGRIGQATALAVAGGLIGNVLSRR